jgi:hypothetical protein
VDRRTCRLRPQAGQQFLQGVGLDRFDQVRVETEIGPTEAFDPSIARVRSPISPLARKARGADAMLSLAVPFMLLLCLVTRLGAAEVTSPPKLAEFS